MGICEVKHVLHAKDLCSPKSFLRAVAVRPGYAHKHLDTVLEIRVYMREKKGREEIVSAWQRGKVLPAKQEMNYKQRMRQIFVSSLMVALG